MTDAVRDNVALKRFELEVDGHTAFLYYRLEPGVITLVHTEVPSALGGRGVGSTLVRGALDAIRAKGLKVIATCPFVAAYLGKHPEFNDLVK
jgi:predicted GNAT family acetyltransferase